MRLRAALVAVILTATAAVLPAAWSGAPSPVGDALDRPALTARQPQHAMLLAAAEAGPRLVAVGERGLVITSDDAGLHWQQAAVPVSTTLTAVRFADGARGMAVGHGGTVLTSADAGSTWTRRLDGRQAAQLALSAAQASGDAAALKAARQRVADGPDKPLLDLWVFDAQRALVVGAYGLAFATDDGGATWTPWMARLDNPKGLHLYAVRARGSRIVIAGEQGLLLQSTDGGRQFSRLDTPYAGSFFTLELPADDEIVVAGLRGNVWRRTDGAAPWAQVPVPMPASITGSALRPDGSLLLANQAGAVLVGRGGALAALKTPPLPPLNAVLARRDGSLLALGLHGAVVLPAPRALP